MSYLRGSEPNSSSFSGTGSVGMVFAADLLLKRFSVTSCLRAMLALALCVAAVWSLSGCSKQTTNAASLTPLIQVGILQAPPPSMLAGSSTLVSAVVNNDVANAGIDWVATCANPPNCGTFSPAHTASGENTTFTAPMSVPNKKNISVTALSTTDRSKASIAIVALFTNIQGIDLTIQPPASLPAGSLLLLGAQVDADVSNLGVDWTAMCPVPSVTGPNPTVLVKCSPSPLHSPAGGTVPFTIPSTVLTNSVIGTTITITGTATADPSFTVFFNLLVTSPVAITITQAPPATLFTNATAPVIAVVANDTTNAGVTWTTSCTQSDCGTVTPGMTASGATATYTAPATVPTPNPPPGFLVTITAISTATGIATQASVMINIIAPVSIQITQGINNNTIALNRTGALVATVSNEDAANPGVDWTVSCDMPGNCGTFTPPHTASGAPTTFTAPSAIPTSGTLTITATSTTDPSKSDQEIVTVTNAPPLSSLLQGNFVVLLSAKNSLNGPFVLGGVITGDGNGNIVAGVFDLADSAGNAAPGALFPVVAPSSYTITADGRGQINLTLNTFALNGSFGVAGGANHTGSFTLSVVFTNPQAASGLHALLTETDGFGDATGTMDQQDAAALAAFQAGTAGVSGTYSMLLTGAQTTPPYPRDFVAAALSTQTSGSSLALTGTIADQSLNGAIVSAPFAAASQSFFSLPTQNGEISLSAVNLGLSAPLNLDLWLIDANHLVVVDWQDATSASGFLGGYLTSQPASPALSGAYAFTESGATTAAQPQVAGGIFTCGATGTLDVVPLGGAALTAQAINATCAAPTNGRGVVAVAGAATGGIAQFAAYPTQDRGTYLLELDGGAAGTSGPSGAGVASQQTLPAPIAASAWAGNYAASFSANTTLGSQGLVAQIISDGVSALAGTADLNSFDATAAPPGASPSLAATVGGTFTAGIGDGRFTSVITFAPTGGQAVPQAATLNSACYIVDATTCLLLNLDPTAPGTGILVHQ